MSFEHVEAAPIPVIDISARDHDQAVVAKALVDAAVDHGFVYIKNGGAYISEEQIADAFSTSREIFASPIEEKMKCKIQKNNQGWSGMHTETLDPRNQRVGDYKEAFNFGKFENGKASQAIPSSIASKEAQIGAFRDACHSLCRRLLLLFGVGLGVDPNDFFEKAHSPLLPCGSILRFLYYPPPSTTASAQQDDVRAGAHSDYGSVTLLFRLKGQSGLELLTGDNVWKPVPVSPPGTEDDATPPILVNIGDLLSYWTDGLLRSTVHRVSFSNGAVQGESSDEPRYSIAFFCHPANETKLTAVPSRLVQEFRGGSSDAKEGNPYAERKVLTADEHLQMRLRASYLDLYEDKPTTTS